MKRKLELTLEQAQKLYKEQPEMRELLLTTFSKEELEGIVLRSYDEVMEKLPGHTTPYFVDTHSEVEELCIDDATATCEDLNIVPSEKHAKSILAFCQLSMLMNDLGDECKVDREVGIEPKYAICRNRKIIVDTYRGTLYHFLTFKTRKIAEAFLEKHRELIEDYFML